MKILYLWDSEYPWDIRVEKTCETLIAERNEIHLVCRNRLRKPLEETYEQIYLHRINCLPNIFGFLNDIFTFPLFFSPIWLKRINQVTRKYNVDLIIARDLPMALSAIFVGKLYKIPVVLDMAECYPELIRLKWKYEPFKIQNLIIRNTFLVDVVERVVLRHVDHVFVMIEESRKRLLEKSIPDTKISIVSNTPILEKFKVSPKSYPGVFEQKRDKIKILYVGLLNFSRGMDTVLESLGEYISKNNNIYLLVLGTGNALDSLRQMVERLGLEEYVKFEGWVDNKLVPKYIASSDICIVPHHKCSHWDNTIPNKLFDYMAASKPVLVSNVEPMKRIVNNTKCGLVFNDHDTASFNAQLETLLDSKLREELGKNGVQAVQSYYNWNNDSKVMIESLKRLLKN